MLHTFFVCSPKPPRNESRDGEDTSNDDDENNENADDTDNITERRKSKNLSFIQEQSGIEKFQKKMIPHKGTCFIIFCVESCFC